MTALVAGHETTASQLAWTFELLAREPGVVRELQRELDAADGETYLNATINESMRRRPVLPNAEPRLTKQEVQIGDWTYPEGVVLGANAYLVHHDPAIYPDPYAFRPERFLDEPARDVHVHPVRRRPAPLPRARASRSSRCASCCARSCRSATCGPAATGPRSSSGGASR